MSRSLRPRLVLGGAALALVVAAGFGVLVFAVRGLERTGDLARHSEEVLAASQTLQSLVLDLETGERGYVITHQRAFLQPWSRARRAIPTQARTLERLVSDNPAQERRARAIAARIADYETAFALPVVRLAERSPRQAAALVATGAGKRRVDGVRAMLAKFNAEEHRLGGARRGAASAKAHQALAIGAAGVLGSMLLIALFTVFLLRGVLGPVRRVAGSAERLARGDLSTRVPELGSGEPAELGRAFNTMASALQEGRDELESQNAELEVQAAELEDQREQLSATNDELETQRHELERAVGQLEEEKERVGAFYGFGERLASETDFRALAETVLASVGDFADAEVGMLYALGPDSSEYVLTATRGIAPGALPRTLEPGHGLAGRALAEGRRVHASHGETGLRVAAFGEEAPLRREVHVPLVHAARVVGVVTLGRLADRPFVDDVLEAVEHMAAQAAVALVTAAAFRDALHQAAINRAVLESGSDGIVMTDVSGRTILANARIEEIAAEILGEPVGLEQGLVSLEEAAAEVAERVVDPDAYRAGFAAVLADPEVELRDEYEIRATGRTYVRYSTPVRDAEGQLLGRILTVREVTREREAERLKTELVATVSHELRTPLTGILGFAELLLKHDVAPRREYLETIHSEAKRLSVLINDFLDLQRIERGSFSLALEPFALQAVLREELEAAAGLSERHELELLVPDEPLVVAGDRERIRQVLGNLVSNAIKYSPQGGGVRIDATAGHASVRVSIQDEGLGIPSDQQQHIFTQFFRVDSSDTRRIGGTGLGLTICREIVEAHGGRIGFVSVEGEGSTFWFELPYGSRRNGSQPARILVIEDESATAALLETSLAGSGYTIETAADGAQGLARALADPPAAICLDIALAGPIDGWRVLTELKDNPATATVPVIVCTAGNGRDRAGSLGAADFVSKPFEPHRLRAAIERILPVGPTTVLVVDDDPSIRRLVVDALAQDGRVVREAADGEEALAAIAASPPDAVVLDLIMPGVDGFAVLEKLQSDPATRWLPVVVLSGRKLSQQERRHLQTRALALIAKTDYSGDELRRLVDLAVAK